MMPIQIATCATRHPETTPTTTTNTQPPTNPTPMTTTKTQPQAPTPKARRTRKVTKPYKPHARTLDPDGDSYIYDTTPKHPWLVSIRGLQIGRYATQEEARAARDNYLGHTRTQDAETQDTPAN